MNTRKIKKYILNGRYALNSRKPLLTYRIFKAYINHILGKMPLRYIDLAITYNCNLDCEHCSAMTLKSSKRQMQLNDYQRLAEQCFKEGLILVGITGGEPLVDSRLFDIIKIFKPNKTMISVKTNGHLLSEQKIDQLSEAGVESVSISLDSLHAPDKKWKDNPSLEAIKRCLKKKFKVMISTCITHQTIRSANVEEILKFGHDKNLIVNLSLGAPIGHWSGKLDVCITKEDRSYIDELEKKFKNVRTDFDANFIREGCGAVKEKVYITPYGDVMPCPFLHIKLGNLLEEPISSIRKRALKNKYWSRYDKICYAAEDIDFINKYLSKTFDSDDLPVDSEIIFDQK